MDNYADIFHIMPTSPETQSLPYRALQRIVAPTAYFRRGISPSIDSGPDPPSTSATMAAIYSRSVS